MKIVAKHNASRTQRVNNDTTGWGEAEKERAAWLSKNVYAFHVIANSQGCG
jgi:hypothetical protein